MAELLSEIKDAVANGYPKILKYAYVVRWNGSGCASNDVLPVWYLFQSKNVKPHLDNNQNLHPEFGTWREYLKTGKQVEVVGNLTIYELKNDYIAVDQNGYVTIGYAYQKRAPVGTGELTAPARPAAEASRTEKTQPSQGKELKRIVEHGANDANMLLRENILHCANKVATYWRRMLLADNVGDESKDALLVKTKIRSFPQIVDDFSVALGRLIVSKMMENLPFEDYTHATIVEYKPDDVLKKACIAAGLREGESDHAFPLACSVRVNCQKMTMTVALKTHREIFNIADFDHPVIEFSNENRIRA